MSKANGAQVLSLEDSIRQLLPETADRKAFRAKWPMYDTAVLAESITKIDADIEAFEDAIMKAQTQKIEWRGLLAECRRRDIALAMMRQRDA